MYKFNRTVLTVLTVLTIASPVFADSSAPPNAEPSKESADRSQEFTKEQKTAAEAALKPLRKLKAATEVGVSYIEYQKRLIDTKAEVEDQLRSVPTGPLKERIAGALEAFEEGSTVWREVIHYKYKSILKKSDTYKIVTKYNLPWKDGRKYSEVGGTEKTVWMMGIWMIASNRIAVADALLDAATNGAPPAKEEPKTPSGDSNKEPNTAPNQ